MSKSLRAGIGALAIVGTLAATSAANAAPPPPVPTAFPVVAFAASAYLLGYGFCTALAFGKQTEAGITGPAARLEAARDCLIPPLGIARYAHRVR
jgi:hypothetical protein